MPVAPEEFFEGHPDGLAIYRRVADVIDRLGETEIRVSTSQFAFRARRWSRTCGGPVSMSTTRFQPYLEIRDLGQVDEEVAKWLRDTYDAAS